jgi:hypothetical protein
MGTMAIAEALIKIIADLLQKRISAHAPAGLPTADTIRERLQNHLTEVTNWSGRIQFFGMSRGEEIDGSTIALKLHTEPRRFRVVYGSRDEPKAETDLLTDDRTTPFSATQVRARLRRLNG